MHENTRTHRRRTPYASSPRTATRSGQAITRLRDGRIYVGYAIYDGSAVSMPTARQLVRDLNGDRLYPPRDLTWPIGEVPQIKWREAVGTVEP